MNSPVIGERLVGVEAWITRFFLLARDQVAPWSKDPRRKIGALVVSPDRRQFTAGYNGFPAGVRDTAERLRNDDMKRTLMVHAELNAILNARRDLTGWMLIVTRFPCHECAKAIVQSGLSIVVTPRPEEGHDTWGDSYKVARTILSEGNVQLFYVTDNGTPDV